MRILGLDTATRATTVALGGAGRTLELRDDPPSGERPRHATRLLPLTTRVLEEAGIGWDSVDRIAVGLGPGTFTGVRIGVATAKALARAANVPLVGVSTLCSLALNGLPTAPAGPDGGSGKGARDGLDCTVDLVVAVLDARRGEVFAAAWESTALQEPDRAVLAPSALAPEVLGNRLEEIGSSAMAIGDGAVAFRAILERSGVYVPEDGSELHRVTAAAHCRIAPRLPVMHPDELQPDYQRMPDAKPRSSLSVRPAAPDPA